MSTRNREQDQPFLAGNDLINIEARRRVATKGIIVG